MAYLPDTAVDLLRELVLGVREVVAEQRAQRRAIEALSAGVAPDGTEALVGAVFAVAGIRDFSSTELIDMSRPGGIPEMALRAMLGNRNAVGVGLLLAGAAGQVCANSGLVLSVVGTTRGVKIWRVSPLRTPAKC